MGMEDPQQPITQTIMQEFQNLKDKFKNEEDDYQDRESPFMQLEKATVLQESRIFHDANVVTQNPRRCCQMISKLLFLLVKGETFTSTEITEVFFGVTKLFQSHDVNLRRMMYLFIKEVAETCEADDVIIVTSSLTKDMNTGVDLYRANSVRVLAKIIDATMLGAIERYVKQAIVDRNAFVASSSLMAGLKLFQSCPDIVRRWNNEVQEAVNSSCNMVQYHALALLYKIKQHDRLAVSKVVQQLSKGSLRSPLATCLLIRYTSKLLNEDMNSTDAKTSYQFIESCLRHKNEMVIFEAAKAMCNLPGADRDDLNPAITVLQLFLSSPKPSLRFAAMRTLSDVAIVHPLIVAKCNDDMEGLVGDSNRSIATLAITTLLKTGNEVSIERLMKQVSSFMSEIGDEFKIVVVKSIKEICTRYPKKHRVMVGFLASFLREEGGYEFKKTIVDNIVELMFTLGETKESSLLHLCEFIEDCEFSDLIVQILHIICSIGPRTPSPSRYIRFVFNRVILESAVVRAAAVSTLGVFAARVPELRPSIMTLLRRSLGDEDDEVRDRAVILLSSFDGEAKEEAHIKFLVDEPLSMSFTALERSIKSYMAHPSAEAEAVTFATLPLVEETYTPAAALASTKKVATSAAADKTGEVAAAEIVDRAAAIYKIPEFAPLGRAFRSSPDVSLTETEMEYVVTCVKHIFANHVVLQFTVLNTIDDQQLRNVRVAVDCSDDCGYTVQSTVPATVARYGEPSNCFVCLNRIADPASICIPCELQFQIVQVDPATGEVESEDSFDEDFPMEALDITVSDYMSRVNLGDFRRGWDQMDVEHEVLEKFALQFKKIDDAVAAVQNLLGMQAVDNTNVIPASEGSKKPHILHLSGVFLGNIQVLARAHVQPSDANSVVLKIAVRSGDKDVSQLVADCIQ